MALAGVIDTSFSITPARAIAFDLNQTLNVGVPALAAATIRR
jgi:hypothetical protein